MMETLDAVRVIVPGYIEDLLSEIESERPESWQIVLLKGRRWLKREIARAPIGIYRYPKQGEAIEAAWPAQFDIDEKPTSGYLLDHHGRRIEPREDLPMPPNIERITFMPGDRLTLTLTATVVGQP